MEFCGLDLIAACVFALVVGCTVGAAYGSRH